MSWFLKKPNGAVYGPVELAQLQRWAGDGRVAPGDLLSPDQQAWRPAPDVPELEMVWEVELPDGTFYGPIHLLATGDLIRDGTVASASRVINRHNGEGHVLGEALLQALLAQNAQCAGLAAEPAATPPSGGDAAAARPVAGTPATPAADPPGMNAADWRDIAAQKDAWEKAALKWQRMYTDAQARAERHEQQQEARFNDLRREDLAARTELEDAQRRLKHLEQLHEQVQLATQGKTDAELLAIQRVALLEAYDGLAQRCDSLLRRLDAKSIELEELNAMLARVAKDAEERLRRMEEQVRQARSDSENARQRALAIEGDHLHLLRAYRELNGHYIQLRQKIPVIKPRPRDNSAAAALEPVAG